MPMLEVRPRSFWSHTWEVFEGEDVLGELRTSWCGESATLTCGDQLFEVARKKWCPKGRWVLLAGGERVLGARKAPGGRGRIEVPVDEETVVLVPEALGGRSFLVTNDVGTILGRIDRQSWLGRSTHIDLPPETPLPAQVFLFTIALFLWNYSALACVGR